MKVREILRAKGGHVATVNPAETVDTLSHRLRMEGVGAMIVSDDGQHLLGIVSERDVVHCVAGHGANALGKTVADIMVSKVVTCKPDDTVATLAHAMTHNRIRHIPVVEAGRLAGIISIGDVVKSRLEEMELESNVLRDLAVAGH